MFGLQSTHGAILWTTALNLSHSQMLNDKHEPVQRKKGMNVKPIPEEKASDFTAIPPEVLEKLQLHLASLEGQLTANDPLIKEHLRNSHSLLITYPETVHLLEDEEIAQLIKLQEDYANTQIVKEVAKGGGGSRSKKSITLDDI